MSIISPRTFRGTRDFLPSELIARRRIVNVIEEAYRRYGFQPLETPAIEYLDILTGKSEENDKLIYEIKRARGDKEETEESAIALRYDLTVPLARVVAQYAELPRPFKRYQIQPVWRADRPQPRQGRFREFVQCDADIVGTSSLLADAEILAMTYEVLRDLGFENFRIRLSSRKFLRGIISYVALQIQQADSDDFFLKICRAIDKLDKVGPAGVIIELEKLGLPGAQIWGILSTFEKVLDHDNLFVGEKFPNNDFATAGLKEIQEVYLRTVNLGVLSFYIKCDPFLARGLDYYTGPIFETVLPDHPHIGSLTGGGRYDGLVGTFSKENVPATGTTIGLDRIQTALTQLGKFKPEASLTQVLVARFDEDGLAENLQIASELRKAGIRTEVWYDDDRMKKQFTYADKQGIPLVMICGPDERAKQEVSIKILAAQEQVMVPRARIISEINYILKSGQGG